ARDDNVPSPSLESKPVEGDWKLPDWTEILESGDEGSADTSFNRDRARMIEETLESFGAPVQVVEINQGPTITQFGVEPDFVEGRGGRKTKVKVSKISSLADDLALALAAPTIRVEAPVPGKGYVGIEVPNPKDSLVALRDVMESQTFQRIDSRLRLGLGRDVSGQPVAADLAAMPHLLIAGATGSGKSVCINAVIACLLLQNTPAQLRFIMVDPKRVELNIYHDLPHLLTPVIVDLQRVVPVLQWVSREMDERYRRFSEIGVRNIADYNARMQREEGKELPYLAVVIDELADLMMMAPNETERVLTRLAQLARATGIHLVIATQRPSVDVVTGLIKANFPARIAFAVASSVDSRVILDQAGAERLLGRGDMLFQPPDAAMPKRLKGVYVSDDELTRLLRYWRTRSLASEEDDVETGEIEAGPGRGAPLKQAPLWEELDEAEDEGDEMYDEAVALVRRRQRASISMLQRRLRIGYTRAARLIDQMERQGIVGPEPGGSKAREVLDYGEMEAEGGG
ncbi:MAG: DNA translocase FtsK, partial [Anaerolineales bacterium]|nr:DNA translocase FtsK [Anaerolineales bacterium]